MNLPPFNPDTTCPKCGHDDVLMIYVSGHRAWDSPRCGLVSTDKYQEHMDRCCQRCHYEWPTAVIAPATEARGGEADA
jgi:hypothetical protein